MKLVAFGLPFMYAMAPRPPPCGSLITGQLLLIPLLCWASLTISRAKMSLPPPGPVSTTICTWLGVAELLELVPAERVEHAVAPMSRTANAATARRWRAVGFMAETPLLDGLVDRVRTRGGHGWSG